MPQISSAGQADTQSPASAQRIDSTCISSGFLVRREKNEVAEGLFGRRVSATSSRVHEIVSAVLKLAIAPDFQIIAEIRRGDESAPFLSSPLRSTNWRLSIDTRIIVRRANSIKLIVFWPYLSPRLSITYTAAVFQHN